MKCVLCSDIDLEYKFRHMTSKKQLEYTSDQLENLNQFLTECNEINPELLFIAGNLFGTSKPKNRTINQVNQCFKKITNQGTEIIILPGPHDTPLPFSNDRPAHHIFSDNNKIHFLNTYREKIFKKVEDPLFEGKIANKDFQIFSPPSPFQRPDWFVYNLQTKSDYCRVFVVSNLFNFKRNVAEIFRDLLEKLKNLNIDLMILGGGKIPPNVKIDSYPFQIIQAPQIHQNSFQFCECEHGLSVHSYGNKKLKEIKDNTHYIPISKFRLIHKKIDVSSLSVTELNEKIKAVIRAHNHPERNILRVSLIGKMEKPKYHNIKIYEFREMGRRITYYFELLDNIKFSETSPDIQGLNVLDELEKFAEKKIRSMKEGENITKDSPKISIYKNSIEKIKEDWKNL
ncbi:MAG: hypothetical protein ACOC44_18570 [Promethearchaeia archaeon]